MVEQWANKDNLVRLEPKNPVESDARKSVGRRTEEAASIQGKSLTWRPVVAKNRFAMLAEEEDDEEEVQTINAVVEEVVEVTVDSGASRSVLANAQERGFDDLLLESRSNWRPPTARRSPSEERRN